MGTTKNHNDIDWRAYCLLPILAFSPFLFLSMIGQSGSVGRPAFAVFALMIAVSIAVARPIWLVLRLHPEPLAQLKKDFAKWWAYSLLFATTTFSLALTIDGTGYVKKAIPQITNFHADPALIAFDRLLFLGRDGWEVSHALFGGLTPFIDASYLWWHFVNLAFVMFICLCSNREMQLRLALSYQLCWILLGNVMATALASVGPCFVETFTGRNDFAPLMVKLEDQAPGAIKAMGYLLENPSSIGSGISAMPSLHVAIAALIAVATRHYFPKFQWIAWSFTALMFVGSIHLGWHYASDGIVSIVGVVVIWKAVALLFRGDQAVRGNLAVGTV